MSKDGAREQEDVLHRAVPAPVSLAIGGVSGMLATTLAHPLDVLKVRQQLSGAAPRGESVARRLLRCQGPRAFYTGLSAGLLRQATYTTTRLGVYDQLSALYEREYKMNPPLRDKIAIGIVSGLAGAVAGNPSEVALVRMMADGPRDPCIPATKPPRYHGCLHALYQITKEEGVAALWRGGVPTLGRSVFVSTAQIGTYAEAREMLHMSGWRGVWLHVTASLVSSLTTAVLTLPLDNIKTQIQAAARGPSPRLADSVRRHGLLHLWAGFTPYYARLSMHTVVTFVMVDQLCVFYETYFL